MPKNVLIAVGLVNAVIAAVAPLASRGLHGWGLVIAAVAAAASAVSSYFGFSQVKKAVARLPKPASVKK